MKYQTKPLSEKGRWKQKKMESGEEYWEMVAGPFLLVVAHRTSKGGSPWVPHVEVNDQEYLLPGEFEFAHMAFIPAELGLREILSKLSLGLGVRGT